MTAFSSSQQPRLACLLLWYPLFTQPFLFREIEELKKLLPTTVISLYGSNLAHCSQEMQNVAHTVKTHGLAYLPKVLGTLLMELITHPRTLCSLARKYLGFRWPSLEIFGENLWAFAMALTLAKHVQENKITMLYAPWPRGTSTCAAVLHERTGIPYVMTVRGDNLAPADPDLGLKMEEACVVRTNNFADQKRIEAFSQRRIKDVAMIYNGLTLPKAPATQSISSYQGNRPLKLLALGRFDVTKGFDILLAACGILKEKGVAFHLTLAGGGGLKFGLGRLEKELRTLTSNLGLDDFVSYPGLLSHNELPNIFADHDLFIAPCVIDASGRRDGLPNTVLEALSCAVPVIASNIHALPEVVRDHETGLLVQEKDPKALSQAICWMAQHPKEAACYGQKGAQLVRELFNPQRNAQKLADLFVRAWQKTSQKPANDCAL